LEAIRNHGGICTDQAAFTVIAAKAWGVPAILFAGVGSRGAHAWLAWQKNPRSWVMDTGRYRRAAFTTGVGIWPSTGEEINDHLLPLYLAQSSTEASSANGLCRLAECLLRRQRTKATDDALKIVRTQRSTHLPAWKLLEERHKDNPKKLLALYEEAIKAFASYPDVQAHFLRHQVSLLNALGRMDEALACLSHLPTEIRRRDDLRRDLGVAPVIALMAQKNPETARLKLQQFLRQNRDDGIKLFPLIDFYLDLTREHHMTTEALTFLKTFIGNLTVALRKDLEREPSLNAKLQGFLEKAQTNHQTASAERKAH
jgi:tetratricopeptide (TPR) repeat protein